MSSQYKIRTVMPNGETVISRGSYSYQDASDSIQVAQAAHPDRKYSMQELAKSLCEDAPDGWDEIEADDTEDHDEF